jgi:DNA-binding MarR family transcriptional regulator
MIKPNDFSAATFRDLQHRLVHLRLSVYEALAHHGPCTTRELAHECGIDLLTVRPRMTELVQMGFALCINEHSDGHEGIYRALTLAEAEDAFNARQAVATQQFSLVL